MKIIVLLVIVFIFSISLEAQNLNSVKKAMEVRLAFALQRPFYVSNDLSDIGLPKQSRYRSAVSAELRYYPFNRSFAEYQLGYSQEGAGYASQFTNANYLKNSIQIGYSALHSRRLIFDMYAGWCFNILLSAKFKNAQTGNTENVGSYYSRTAQGISLGLGVKTKIKNDLYIGLSTFMNIGVSPISKNVSPEELQFVIPAFKISVSKLIRYSKSMSK